MGRTPPLCVSCVPAITAITSERETERESETASERKCEKAIYSGVSTPRRMCLITGGAEGTPPSHFWATGPADIVASIERVGPALVTLSKLMHERASIERSVG
jgi:hypothetical protein